MKFNIVSTCRMGAGTFEAKFKPLSLCEDVDKIVIVRKELGPVIPKVLYRVLPKICKNPLMNMLITPFVIIREVKKHKARFILAYHYVPHFYLAFIASIFTRTPYILGQTGSDVEKLAAKPLKGAFLRMVVKKAVYLNVPGNKSLNFWNGLGFDNVQILHSSIDTDYYVPSEAKKEYDFIYIGRLEDYKGVNRIIEAMKRLVGKNPALSLAIVGYGSQEDDLKRMVEGCGLAANVSFHGFQKDIRSWLYKSRIFVMASDNEGLPCALMEAMSCGMICITSLVGNIGDILLDGETGFGFHLSEVDRLCYLMEYVYNNQDSLQELQDRAREIIVKEHSYRSSIELWEKEFMQLKEVK
jgi:glycosyltransferase involved in cell wall biosynthesis